MYVGFHLFLFDFDENVIFLTDFRQILVSNLMKSRSVVAELFSADEQT